MTVRLARKVHNEAIEKRDPNAWQGVPYGNTPTLGPSSGVFVNMDRFPSKSYRLVANTLEEGQIPIIFRSDSNMEDKLGQSAAGLFESIAM